MQGILRMKDDSGQLMNTLLRMVVPMRREFGRNLDVKHFLHDFEYQQDIIKQALTSQDPRLREYTQYVQTLVSGPRGSTQPPAPPKASAAPVIETLSAAPQGRPAEAAGGKSEEDELRDRIMRKYTTGLR